MAISYTASNSTLRLFISIFWALFSAIKHWCSPRQVKTCKTEHIYIPTLNTEQNWRTKWLSSPIHPTPLIWHPVTSSYFQKWNWSWKDAGLIPLRRYRPNHRECLTHWLKRTSRKRSRNGDGGTGVYMPEGTTSRVTVADSPYGEFYDFYSISLDNFGYQLVIKHSLDWLHCIQNFTFCD